MLAGKMSAYGLALIMRCQIPFADLNLFAGLLCFNLFAGKETLICAAVLIMRMCSLATEIGNKTRLVNAQGWIEKH